MLCDLVLVAGGSSSRFASDIPKQFQNLFGKPLYLWSLDTFLSWENIGNVVIVVPEDWVEPVESSFRLLIEGKQIHVVSGGSSRQASSEKGVKFISSISQNKWVAIHDAARPCITLELLNSLWDVCVKSQYSDEFAGVVPGVKVNETVKSVDEMSTVKETLHREALRIIQTPQILKTEVLLSAFDIFKDEQAVDDACLVEKLGRRVVVVDSSYDNLKVTFSEDTERVSNWFRKRHPQI